MNKYFYLDLYEGRRKTFQYKYLFEENPQVTIVRKKKEFVELELAICINFSVQIDQV